MAKFAILLPNEEMYRQTHDVLQELKERVDIIKIIETKNSVSEARQAINQGAEIIIARGLQATIIKQYTDIPVVEITMTEQGIQNIIQRAKRILGKERPDIAFVMFRNMTCEMAGMGEKMNVNLREYYVQNPELLRDAAIQAVEDKADLIIGGATALEIADAAGVPSLFLTNTDDAIAEAMREALHLAKSFEKGGKELKKTIKKTETPFVHFQYQSEKMSEAVKLARILSETDCPKLIVEPVGTLYHALARGIHNHSSHSMDKLTVYDCVEGESAYEALFGSRGLLTSTGKGSFQINEIEYLDRRSQRKLLEIMLFRHIITVTKKRNLKPYLLPELYERLRPFAIDVPDLSESREDIALLLHDSLMNLSEKYGKYHVLTKDAERFLCDCKWRGNRIQLESFMERLVLCAEKRSIGKGEAERLYEELYGNDRETPSYNAEKRKGTDRIMMDFSEDETLLPWENDISEEESSSLHYSEKDELIAALRENFGNRRKTAEKLGISATTLWRKLKKYDLL